MEETLETLSDMVAQGKILYYGVSEWSPVQITKALGLIQKHGYRPLSVIQPQYNKMCIRDRPLALHRSERQ